MVAGCLRASSGGGLSGGGCRFARGPSIRVLLFPGHQVRPRRAAILRSAALSASRRPSPPLAPPPRPQQFQSSPPPRSSLSLSVPLCSYMTHLPLCPHCELSPPAPIPPIPPAGGAAGSPRSGATPRGFPFSPLGKAVAFIREDDILEPTDPARGAAPPCWLPTTACRRAGRSHLWSLGERRASLVNVHDGDRCRAGSPPPYRGHRPSAP